MVHMNETGTMSGIRTANETKKTFFSHSIPGTMKQPDAPSSPYIFILSNDTLLIIPFLFVSIVTAILLIKASFPCVFTPVQNKS